MVRFIIKRKSFRAKQKVIFTFQYGQIYYLKALFALNQQLLFTFQYGQIYYVANSYSMSRSKLYLHSNMVRFIIFTLNKSSPFQEPFTFQYGQIYYLNIFSRSFSSYSFSFQYGQIYYPFVKWSRGLGSDIYIPIWLDLLSRQQKLSNSR